VVCVLSTLDSPAETDESIEMPFGEWTQSSPRNDVVSGAWTTAEKGAILGGPSVKYREYPA